MDFESEASPIDVYQRFDAYDFMRDDAFQAGLASILAGNPQTSSDTIRMAKLFYYSKKVEAIDLTDYMAWKEPPRPLTEAEIERALLTQDLSASMGPHPESNVGLDSQSSALDMPSGSPNPGSANVAAEMSYPATFAEIVELIKSGKPIPGIKQIPDKTAEGEASTSKVPAKAKPWEQAEEAGSTTAPGTQVTFF